jgi:hypothetical protein
MKYTLFGSQYKKNELGGVLFVTDGGKHENDQTNTG